MVDGRNSKDITPGEQDQIRAEAQALSARDVAAYRKADADSDNLNASIRNNHLEEVKEKLRKEAAKVFLDAADLQQEAFGSGRIVPGQANVKQAAKTWLNEMHKEIDKAKPQDIDAANFERFVTEKERTERTKLFKARDDAELAVHKRVGQVVRDHGFDFPDLLPRKYVKIGITSGVAVMPEDKESERVRNNSRMADGVANDLLQPVHGDVPQAIDPSRAPLTPAPKSNTKPMEPGAQPGVIRRVEGFSKAG